MEHSLQRLNAAQRSEIWAERIRECRSSGKSVRAWCREHEISEKTYYYWQRKLYQQIITAAEPVRFAEITCGEETGRNCDIAAKISLAGATVEVYSGADSQMVQTILQELRTC